MKSHHPLTYRVHAVKPEAHQFSVELRVAQPPTEELVLTLPAWTPGSYLIRDLARHLLELTAEDAAGMRPLEKIDKQTWRLAQPRGSVTLRYRVFACEMSVRTAYLDTERGFFNGPALFLRAAGLDRVPCRVELAAPVGESYRDWRVATSLERLDTEPFGFGAYQAADYEDLIDHPVEMGRFELIAFEVRNVPHWAAITGRHHLERGKLTHDLSRICEQHATLFGELPVDRYLFQLMTTADTYGGLEHSHSTSLMCAREDLRTDAEPTHEGYVRFLGLCSHEYFHLWHVKRIRPQAFSGGQLDRERYTQDLWAFEGITSYYDDLALVRSGCIDVSTYLSLLARLITRVMRNPGRRGQTIAESSFDAWIKLYKADENAPNALVSYYEKGALVALALDLKIRERTAGQQSLDDVMRILWERHGRTRRALPERGLEVIASEIAGEDLHAFFDLAIRSTSDLDLAGPLASVGLALRMRPARAPNDQGGLVNRHEDLRAPSTWGLRWQSQGRDIVVRSALNDAPAERAGLAPGDVIVAVDGLRVGPEGFDDQVARLAPGVVSDVHVFRRDELRHLRVRSAAAPADTCELRLASDGPAASARSRAAWLGQPC